MTGDLPERSGAHWSETHRLGMDAFYRLATDDYRHPAQARDWASWLGAAQAQTGGRPLRLLDVACGSAKFPNALVRYAGFEAGLRPVKTDLLDPSAFSLAEARGALPEFFMADADHETTLQDFRVPQDGYDIVWAVHALYAVPPVELAVAAERFLAALGPRGRGVIAHSAATGHYVAFHRLYLSAYGPTGAVPYVSAEMVADALRAAGGRVDVSEVVYDTCAGTDETRAVEGYLQRCVFDDSATFEKLRADPALADYLDACRANDGWRFSQRVHLIDVAP